jgi:hypothetical protein
MVKPIIKDIFFLNQKSEPATKADNQVVQDLLDTLKANEAGCKSEADELTVRDCFPDMVFDGELYRDDLNKVSYVLNSYQDFLETRKEFPDMQNGTWGGAGERALFGDIGVKGITKGNAIARLLDHLGMDVESTIAFGDAKIDIPMLEYCHIGVAMGNGGEEIRAMADLVTDDVEQNGLYKGFVKLGLVEGTL